MTLQDELNIVKKAQTDPEAFSEIYEQNYSKIFNYILKRVMNLEVAQDITSEVFIKAFRNIWQFQFRKIPFSAWLYRIASNEICNFVQKNYHKTVSLDQLLEENGYEPVENSDPRKDLIAAEKSQENNEDFYKIQIIIRELPLKFQTIISLKFFEKKSLKEIGQIMGKKEGTVKSTLSRAIEKLRKLIQEQGNTTKIKNFQDIEI